MRLYLSAIYFAPTAVQLGSAESDDVGEGANFLYFLQIFRAVGFGGSSAPSIRPLESAGNQVYSASTSVIEKMDVRIPAL